MLQESLISVDKIYQDRSLTPRQLKANGEKVFGYLCCLTPVELLTAAGLVPIRIKGNPARQITEADAYLESIACSFTRGCIDAALLGEYDYLDGFVLPHSCDNIVKLYDIWKHNFEPAFSHFVNVPHVPSAPSHKYFQAELETFRHSLERFLGIEITDQSLLSAILAHNRNRALVRALYWWRKTDPPLLSGQEIAKIMVVNTSLPVEKANALLQQLIREVKEREDRPVRRPARLLVHGSDLDNADLIGMIEDCGSNVVMDDLCFGYKPYRHDVATDGNPLTNLADYYLTQIPCPRFLRQVSNDRSENLEHRYGYLRDEAREFNVNGVIDRVLIYCDTHALESPDRKEFLENEGFPVLVLEDEYTMTSTGRLQTRVEAFIEMITGSKG